MLIKAGDIISKSWQVYAENFKKLLPYMAFLFVPNFILGLVGYTSLYLDRYASSGMFVLANNIIMLAVFVASLIFTLWAAMALAKNLGAIIAKQPLLAYKESFSITSHLLWPIIYTTLLVGLIVAGGTVLFIIPGIIFAVWYCFTYYNVLFEEKRGIAALVASKSMVAGRWWQILWRLVAPAVFYGLILLILSSALTYIAGILFNDFTYIAVNGLANSLISVVISPLTALTTLILYFSAKENPAPIKTIAPTK
jgi:hypothetical protein